MGVLAMTSLFSCGVDRWPEYYPLTGRDLWIDSLMRQEYLWYEDIPASKTLNYFLAPSAFLDKIKSPLDKGYSSVDTLYAPLTPGYGFDYSLYRIADNDTAFNAMITYVIPGSPADRAQLRRGEWIMMIDNDYITRKTEDLLTEGGTRELLIGNYFTQEDEEGNLIGFIRSNHTATLPAARPVEKEAIPAYNILTAGNLKVGYLAYNSFDPDYNAELIELSQLYKSENITDFVLDLRYNAGGEMECVQLMADILAPAASIGSPLASLIHSDKQAAKNRNIMLDGQLLQGGANLNLPKLYVLTGTTTAAASEMLINCLRPYMDVILIGATTAGVTVATASFYDNRFPYILRPVVCEVYNSEGEADYSNGFTPDYAVSEFSNPAKVLPLGHPDEALLGAALGIIAGSIEMPEPEPDEPESQMELVKSVKTQRYFRNGLILK